ncbi:MAG TPA: BON domain-containing protein [Chitinophagaceae bacterium]|nr:BON domain-containing protein [Chitinophagaceae bacterium]
MKSDTSIRNNVLEELRWEPILSDTRVEVGVTNGMVTLNGTVDTYSKKVIAEKATRRVAGVKGLQDDLQVRPSAGFRRTDAEILEAVRNALTWHTGVREEDIRVSVHGGNLKLEGEVAWEYQRGQVQTAVENLAGVISVTNLISVKPKVSATDVQQKIQDALIRSAAIDSGKITVDVDGSKVVLRGSVRSLLQKQDAEAAAWNAPGVISVENRLEVEDPDDLNE